MMPPWSAAVSVTTVPYLAACPKDVALKRELECYERTGGPPYVVAKAALEKELSEWLDVSDGELGARFAAEGIVTSSLVCYGCISVCIRLPIKTCTKPLKPIDVYDQLRRWFEPRGLLTEYSYRNRNQRRDYARVSITDESSEALRAAVAHKVEEYKARVDYDGKVARAASLSQTAIAYLTSGQPLHDIATKGEPDLDWEGCSQVRVPIPGTECECRDTLELACSNIECQDDELHVMVKDAQLELLVSTCGWVTSRRSRRIAVPKS